MQTIQTTFLVGCSRSGTTLLQSLLAAHPQVFSVPESKFFWYADPVHEAKRLRIGIASRRLKPWLKTFFNEIGYPDYRKTLPVFPLPLKNYTQYFFKKMSQLTEAQGKTIFLEKTPEHLRYLEQIQTFLPQAKVIHLVRSGKDTIASMYELVQKYPKTWGYGERNLDYCINRWSQEIRISQAYRDHPQHIIARYEQLACETSSVLEQLCVFMGIQFDPEMLTSYQTASTSLVRNRESWKAGVQASIQSPHSDKFSRVLTPEQQSYVLEKLAAAQLDNLNLIF